MYPTFLIITIFLFLIRWTINWRILNKQNQTKFSFFTNPMDDFFSYLKHVFISEWTLYWENADKSILKKISNILSLLTLVSLLWTIYAFTKYKY